jgi:hypothetical protein
MLLLANVGFGKGLPAGVVHQQSSLGFAVLRLQPDTIVDSVSQPLLAANVPLSCLNARAQVRRRSWGATPTKPH